MRLFKLEDKIDDIMELFHTWDKEDVLERIYRLNAIMDKHCHLTFGSSNPLQFVSSYNTEKEIREQFLKNSTKDYNTDRNFISRIKVYLNSIIITDKIKWCMEYGNKMDQYIYRPTHNRIIDQLGISSEETDYVKKCIIRVRDDMFPDMSIFEFCMRLRHNQMYNLPSVYIRENIIDICNIHVDEYYGDSHYRKRTKMNVDRITFLLEAILNHEIDYFVDMQLSMPKEIVDHK